MLDWTEGHVTFSHGFGRFGGYSFQPRHVFAQLSKLLVLSLSLSGELVATVVMAKTCAAKQLLIELEGSGTFHFIFFTPSFRK